VLGDMRQVATSVFGCDLRLKVVWFTKMGTVVVAPAVHSEHVDGGVIGDFMGIVGLVEDRGERDIAVAEVDGLASLAHNLLAGQQGTKVSK